jgi:hypothetical protein
MLKREFNIGDNVCVDGIPCFKISSHGVITIFVCIQKQKPKN